MKQLVKGPFQALPRHIALKASANKGIHSLRRTAQSQHNTQAISAALARAHCEDLTFGFPDRIYPPSFEGTRMGLVASRG